MRMSSTIAPVVFAGALCAWTIPVGTTQSPGEPVAADIRKQLPDGWTCTLISEKGKMGHPHGLEEPLFRLDFVNSSVAFTDEIGPVHPNLRLHFHASAERDRILKTIEAERAYSWAIPTLFADTREYVVVTSPMWQNHFTTRVGDTNWGVGVYTEEANRLIAPLLQALKKYFDGPHHRSRHRPARRCQWSRRTLRCSGRSKRSWQAPRRSGWTPAHASPASA
jgi:hypothetical protein